MAQVDPLTRRQRVTQYFGGLLRQKLAGLIDQKTLESLNKNHPFDEQIPLGIGAITEVRQK